MIHYRSEKEIAKIAKAARLVARTLAHLRSLVAPGVTTKTLDSEAKRFIEKGGGTPSFLNYLGYPANICTSVNDTVIHGVPGDVPLREGDIVGLDVGVRLDGFCGDGAVTLPVGEVDEEKRRLLQTGVQALMLGVRAACPGNRIADVSRAIQIRAEADGFNVVREFVGHGIGRSPHEDPQVPNFVEKGRAGKRLREGMVICIEPMVNGGTWRVKKLEDGWTIKTGDGKPSVHFEHQVVIRTDGPQILTVAQ